MITVRETIYAALLTQLQGALSGTFKTISRHWQPPDQISPADRPALYQVQKDEVAARPTVNGLPTKWTSTLDLVMYTTGSTDPGVNPSTELNALLDAIENALKTVTPGLNQTLGAKVNYCRIEGKIEIVENVQGAMALAVVPISLEILG
jgi:hypothetical protein